MKFLVVEDNVKMRSFIIKTVERNFKTIETIYECDSGEEATKLCKKYHPDWILLDIHLKKMDGLKAAQLIRNSDPTAKIIIVTQHDDPAYRELASAVGAVGYVLKEHIYDLINIINRSN